MTQPLTVIFNLLAGVGLVGALLLSRSGSSDKKDDVSAAKTSAAPGALAMAGVGDRPTVQWTWKVAERS